MYIYMYVCVCVVCVCVYIHTYIHTYNTVLHFYFYLRKAFIFFKYGPVSLNSDIQEKVFNNNNTNNIWVCVYKCLYVCI